jgi:tRNA 2-selenouridine synthase
VLAGYTGAGKTRLLQFLSEAGQQVVDLEALARHRGSVFGGILREPQPTVEQFENDLFFQLHRLNAERPVWVEGESKAIGRVQIPHPFWQQMTTAPTIVVEVDRPQRIAWLMEQYGDLPTGELATAITRLRKRLGGVKLHAAMDALERRDLRTFVSIALEYYDKRYLRSLNERSDRSLIRVPMSRAADPNVVAACIEHAENSI